MTNKQYIINILTNTERPGISGLLEHMDKIGFYEAPCSGQYHLAKIGGLAEHSLNVYYKALELCIALMSSGMSESDRNDMKKSIAICALLHDIGKCGQFGKPNYVPNQSDSKPFVTNPELLYVDHEVRSLAIISKYIDLTEEEQIAILWHNGLYSVFKYEIPGKETPLQMMIHFADLWCSRVVEKEG